MVSHAVTVHSGSAVAASAALTAPCTALVQRASLDSLPYLDGAPNAEQLSAARALIAAAAESLPRKASAYLDTSAPSPSTAPAPSCDTAVAPCAARPALEIATATAECASASVGRGELGVRFGGTAWKERCTLAERALASARRDTANAGRQLAAINRRRSVTQRAVAGHVSKLRREYFEVARDNREIANEIQRLRGEKTLRE